MSYAYHARAHARCGRMRWKPIELLAIILGFILFWPVGLAMLGWKIWQAKTAYAGDFGQFAQEKWGGFEKRSGLGEMARQFTGEGLASSGNTAFDDWRKAELPAWKRKGGRSSRRKRRSTDYVDGLRRAKDREEFERFMASRAQQGPASPGSHS